MIIGTWQFNLLETWLEAYKRENLAKITLEKNNSITVDMGLMREFSCPDQRLNHKMTLKLESEQKEQDDMFYSLTESHSDFLNGKSIQEFWYGKRKPFTNLSINLIPKHLWLSKRLP